MIQALRLQRAYEPASASDGCRVLIDRIRPRDVRKADARLGRWLKDIAPGTTPRPRLGHRPERWSAVTLAGFIGREG